MSLKKKKNGNKIIKYNQEWNRIVVYCTLNYAKVIPYDDVAIDKIFAIFTQNCIVHDRRVYLN